MLKQRILTALFLIPLVLAAIFWVPQIIFSGLLVLLVIGCAWEWSSFCKIKRVWEKMAYVASALVVLAAALLFLRPHWIVWSGVGLWCVIAGLVVFLSLRGHSVGSPYRFPTMLTFFMGIWILTAFFQSLLLLHIVPKLLLTVLLYVWTADTAAYFGGKKWGKKKLAPGISPNKTWEGFFTALCAVLILSWVLADAWGILKAFLWQWILVAALTFLAAVLGDLFESLLKRSASLKDSGTWVPGHGGMLDRIDSLLAAVPVFTTLIFAFGFF